MLITEKIQSYKSEINRLQERYKELVSDIKNTFYEHTEYFDKTTPLKPTSDTAIMSAAFCFANGRCPRSKYNLDIRRADVWKSEPKAYLDYWLVYPDEFNSNGLKTPTRILRKDDIKILEDDCKEAWKYVVNGKFGKSTVLGFSEWLEKTSCDKIIEILHEIYEDRIIEVTEKKLYLKDIIIIYPEKKFEHDFGAY